MGGSKVRRVPPQAWQVLSSWMMGRLPMGFRRSRRCPSMSSAEIASSRLVACHHPQTVSLHDAALCGV